MVLFDTSNNVVKDITKTYSQILACSPDGRTLIGGEGSGIIELFDFEISKILYRVSSVDNVIKELAFNEDSHRLPKIRESHCRVGDPIVLMRQDSDEEASDTVSISTTPPEVSLESSKMKY